MSRLRNRPCVTTSVTDTQWSRHLLWTLFYNRLSRLDLGKLTIISAGAITQAALFTLFRLPMVIATASVYDDDQNVLSNLNRNMLSRRRDVTQRKVDSIAAWTPTSLHLNSICERFGSESILGRLSGQVIVGVDDIPSRWAAQRVVSDWLGVAGTTHFGVLCSSHIAGQACAGCLHPRNDLAAGEIPTVSFVSFWAGLTLAVRLIRHVLGSPYSAAQQHCGCRRSGSMLQAQRGGRQSSREPTAPYSVQRVGC